MGLFNKKSKKNKNDKKTATVADIADNGLSVSNYKGPNVLGVATEPSVFIYGHPISIKIVDSDPTKIQAGLFVSNTAELAKIYPDSILENTTEQGLPIRLTFNTPSVETAQALIKQLLATHNLMLAANGNSNIRVNQQGIRQIELLIDFGSFIIINATDDGHAEITTTQIEVNKSANADSATINHTAEVPSDTPSNFAEDDTNTEPAFGDPEADNANTSRTISGAENIDPDGSIDSTANSGDDFSSKFNSALKGL